MSVGGEKREKENDLGGRHFSQYSVSSFLGSCGRGDTAPLPSQPGWCPGLPGFEHLNALRVILLFSGHIFAPRGLMTNQLLPEGPNQADPNLFQSPKCIRSVRPLDLGFSFCIFSHFA
jgi:hypothetical protein